MGIQLEPNGTGDNIMFDVTIEQDEGVFLCINGESTTSYEPMMDYITTDPQEIEAFFKMVEAAKSDWEKRKEDAGN